MHQMTTNQALSAVGALFSNVSSYLPLNSEKIDEVVLSEHNFDEFAELLEINDRISLALAEGLSEEDTKTYELEPPRVIVVGLTSAGKSSLLERVIGHSIFPVRDNVCTRRPFRVQLKKSAKGDVNRTLRFIQGQHKDRTFELPQDLEEVRNAIEQEQRSDSSDVAFSAQEITAEISSGDNQTFTFTDLPGIFLVSERKMGQNYAESRQKNETLMKQTVDIMKQYLEQKNTIVLAVVSATDWMHGLNNDPFISHLAEWLERIRTEENRDVPVYGVITKLDMQKDTGLSENSPVKKVLLGQLPKDHILNGLKVRKWIPVVSSKDVLAHGDSKQAAALEEQAIKATLAKTLPANLVDALPIGRAALLRELKQALLVAIRHSYGNMQKSVDKFSHVVEEQLNKLPQVVQNSEKRRIFDGGLKRLEENLNNLIGARGRHVATEKGVRSLRMRLMVDTPKLFEDNLRDTDLRGDLTAEVGQILDQSALEQGGSFDSDVSFTCLSQKIIERFTEPCMRLVDGSSSIIAEAVRTAVNQAFGEYKMLEMCILSELGVPNREDVGSPLSTNSSSFSLPAPQSLLMFQLLTQSARHKVLNLLDAFQMMDCFHPMWRNFDRLYQNVLLRTADEKKKKGENEAESCLQDVLDLPSLAKRARQEGELAIQTYETEAKQKLPQAQKEKIAKHFARIEVMGYIIRMTLTSAIFPIVLRDIRDGLFRGIAVGMARMDASISQLLRDRLIFDSKREQMVFDMMEPSGEDIRQRTILVNKKETLVKLKQDFSTCQSKLARLVQLLG